jgi:hypothetical protein
MNIEDVKVWVIDRGIGHVVMRRDNSSPIGTITACGMGGNMHQFTYCKPSRICKGCREELPRIFKVREIAL